MNAPYVATGAAPGQQLGPGVRVGTAFGPGDPSDVASAPTVGAIEYYAPSERPVQFGTTPCALVVVWTLPRLGLAASPGAPDIAATSEAPVVRGTLALAGSRACVLPTSADTGDFPIYAMLEGSPLQTVGKKVFAAYTDSVLSVIDRWSVLPTELRLPTIGAPFIMHPDASDRRGAPRASDVAPTLSSVFLFTLDSSGALTGARVAASTLAGSADTSMLAELERAAAARAFPHIPRNSGAGGETARFDLVVTSIEPVVGTKAAILGRLEVPVWPLARAARPSADATFQPSTADSATVQLVVDGDGRAASGTVRLLAGTAREDRITPDSGSRRRLARTLDALRFDPAVIGGCAVPQLVTQRVAVPRAQTRISDE